MPLNLFKRGNIWFMRGTVSAGKLSRYIRETTRVADEKAAQIIAAKREAELIEELIHGKKAFATFTEAVISYLEAGGESRFLGTETTGLIGWFAHRRLNTITQGDLDEAAKELGSNMSRETRIRQIYTPFIAVWNHAARRQLAEPRIWERPKKPKGTRGIALARRRSGTQPVSFERAAIFVASMSPAPAMVMTALFYTGMRPIELFALQAENVDVPGRWITLLSSKTGEPRGVPMHDFLAPMFEALVTDKAGEVFLTHKGDPYPLTDQGGGQLKTAVNGARKRTAILEISPYTGRHSVSTQLVINNVHPHIKDQILGHAATDMSRHYTNVPQQPLIDAINTLPVPTAWRSLDWWSDPVKARGTLVTESIWAERAERLGIKLQSSAKSAA